VKGEEKEKFVDPRFVAICWEDFVDVNNDKEANNNSNNVKINNSNNNKVVNSINNKIGNTTNDRGAFALSNSKGGKFGNETILNDESKLNSKIYNFNHDESALMQNAPENFGNKNDINDNDDNNNNNKNNNDNLNEEGFKIIINEKIDKKKRLNVYPYKIYYKLFKKTIVSISRLSKTNAFISSFNIHFIYKLYIGSWANLNFFEIIYQGNEMNEFYIKYKMDQVNARPISDFNSKKGLQIAIDDNNFFGKYRSMYGNLWKPVQNPLITDTRYREDLLWLMRFYEIVEKFPENESNPDKLDSYDKVRLEAFLNAGKWKEVLEAYTYLNISKKINPKEK
jgi:hypothetical protein